MTTYDIVDSTTDKSKVCIAMLAYNHEDFISDAMEGILNQKADFKAQPTSVYGRYNFRIWRAA